MGITGLIYIKISFVLYRKRPNKVVGLVMKRYIYKASINERMGPESTKAGSVGYEIYSKARIVKGKKKIKRDNGGEKMEGWCGRNVS